MTESTNPHRSFAELIDVLEENGFLIHRTDFDWEVEDENPTPFSFEAKIRVTDQEEPDSSED